MNFRIVVAEAAIAALLATGITVGRTVYDNVTYQDTTPIGQHQPLPKLPPDKPGQPTDLETIEAKLGPFHLVQPSPSNQPDTAYPAVLLIRQDGSTEASSKWSVPLNDHDSVTQQQLPSQIIGYQGSGQYITFSTGPDRAYTVRIGQAFVLEQAPQQVFAFDPFGGISAVGSAQAIALRQHL